MSTSSPLHKRLFDRLNARHKRTTGLIVRRTRSRNNSSGPSSSATSTNTQPSARDLTTRIETGAITKRKSTSLTLITAAPKLRHKRLQLKKRLENDDKFRDEHGYLYPSYRHKLRQLSHLTPTGALGDAPAPKLATWMSEQKMTRRRKRWYWPSELSQVERVWSEDELEREFGLLPGENRNDDEMDLFMELDVEEGEVWEGRAMEDLQGGYCVGGVWREVLQVRKGDVERPEKWLQESVALERMMGGEVMDRRCMGIVEGVWEMNESR